MGLNAFMAFFMVVGGTIGYVKKKSIISLIAGGLVCAWYLYAVKMYVVDRNEASMRKHAEVVSGLVFLMFLNRYAKSRATMPLIITISAAITGATNFLL